MKYEMILFDIDDTLMDFSKSEHAALHNTFMKYEMPTGFSDYHGSYREISQGIWAQLEAGEMELAQLGVERFKRLFETNALDLDAQTFSEGYLDYLGRETHLMEGAEELCRSLDCRMAVITNGFGTVQKARIQNSPLRDSFEALIISEETGFQKPHWGIFNYAFEKLQLTDKSKVLIVGDSLTSDIKGGHAYGIDTCWFNPMQKTNHTGVTPTYEIRKLAEVAGIVEGSQSIK